MVEKLNSTKTTIYDLLFKINELVDAVNELQMDQKTPADSYSEQRKALDVAVDALKMIGSGDIIEHSVVGHEDDNKIFIANKALEQITALEQKDV